MITIRHSQIQLIDQTGLTTGTVRLKTRDFRQDGPRSRHGLVEISRRVAEQQSSPFARSWDLREVQYSAQKPARQSRKKQKVVEIKEIKLLRGPIIDDHEITTT